MHQNNNPKIDRSERVNNRREFFLKAVSHDVTCQILHNFFRFWFCISSKDETRHTSLQGVPKQLPTFNLKQLWKYWAKILTSDVFGMLKCIVVKTEGKTSDWSIFAGKPPLIDQ